jgi:predicted MFS family arabinose efflux permease
MPAKAGPSRWTILALLFVARVGLSFQFQTMGSVADPLVADLHLTFTEIGTLIGLFMLPGIFLAIPAGLAGRYAPDRILAAGGLATLAVGGLVAATAHGFAGLAAGRLICGLGFVLTSLYFTKMLVDWFAGREIATAMAVLVMSWPFGIAMGQVGHSWLAATEGWRWPFVVASLYCLAVACLVFLAYRPPPAAATAPAAPSMRLTGREWTLTLIAAVVWSAFNAAYVVYLSFAPRVLVAAGDTPLHAASVISLASWVMIFSATLCGQVADRTGKSDLIMTVCMLSAIASLLLLPQPGWAVPLSLVFGLIGVAPAGIMMALTGAAMAPQKRAFGMGVFLSVYFLGSAFAPGLAGRMYDRSHDAFLPIVFAAALFGLTLLAYFAFRLAQRRLA